eukprot:GEMP01001241.1.p1 GENE.GEMP01001241.1~~GEMP01001241.1.p1  ORF type:complete len:1385 (+),score=305.97 GEMP01001241.1:168-4322(+)
MSQALVNHQLPDDGLRDKMDSSVRRHPSGPLIMDSPLGVRHGEIRGVENPRGPAGGENRRMQGRTVDDGVATRPSSGSGGVHLMKERRASGPPRELPRREYPTSPPMRDGYPPRDMPRRDSRGDEFPPGNLPPRESQLRSSRESPSHDMPPKDLPRTDMSLRDSRDGGFVGRDAPPQDPWEGDVPPRDIPRRDLRDGGFPPRDLPQRDSIGGGLPSPGMSRRDSRDGGLPPRDVLQRDSRDGGLPPRDMPLRDSRDGGLPPRNLPPRDSREGGLPPGDTPQRDSRAGGFPPRDIPRRDSIDGGLPPRDVPLRNSRDSGLPPRDIPQRDSWDGDLPSRDMPLMDSMQGGLPPRNLPPRDSREGALHPRDTPQRDSRDGGLPPRDITRRDSVDGGLSSRDTTLRDSRDGDVSPRNMPLRDSREGGLPTRNLPPRDSREGELPPRDFPRRDSMDGGLPPRDMPRRDSMDGGLPRGMPLRDSRDSGLPAREMPLRDSREGGLPPQDISRRDSRDGGFPPRDMPRRDPRDGGLPPRDKPLRDSREDDLPQGDRPPRDSRDRVFAARDVRRATTEGQHPPRDMLPRDAADVRGSREGLHSQEIIPHDLARRGSREGYPPRDLPLTLPPRDIPLAQDFGNDGFPRDIPAQSSRDSGVPPRDLPPRDAPVRESLEARGAPSPPRYLPSADGNFQNESLRNIPSSLFAGRPAVAHDNLAPPFASSPSLSDSLALSQKRYAQPPCELPPRELPPRELPPRELPAPDSYAETNRTPTRQFQPRHVEGPTPFDEADDQAGDLPDFAPLDLAVSDENHENAQRTSWSPRCEYPEQQQQRQHQYHQHQLHGIPPPPNNIADILPAPQPSQSAQPRTRPMPPIIGSQVFPDTSANSELPKLPRNLSPPDSSGTMRAPQKHSAPSGEDSENEESSSEHSMEEQIAVGEDDATEAAHAAQSNSQHEAYSEYEARSPVASRQLLVDSDCFDYCDPVVGTALTEDEIAEEEISSPLRANQTDERREARWSAMGFVQHKLRKTFFREDSRVIPMCTMMDNSRMSGKLKQMDDDPFSSPPRPNPVMPQEYTWDAFVDKKLRHLDHSQAKTNGRRSLSSLHEAIDLIPCPDWSTMPRSVKKAFLMQPLPGKDVCVQDGRNLAMHAQLIRRKGSGFKSKFFPTYTLLVGYAGQQQVLLSAQKATGRRAKTPYYILSTDPNCFVKDSESYVGKLRSNWLSTEYTCFGTGKNPKKETVAEQNREELIAVKFTKPGNAPRRMEVVLPMVHSNGSREMCRPESEKDGLMAQTGNGDNPSFIRYVSKLPTWDAKRQTFTINFHGRVRHASSKNFQLIDADGSNESRPIVQFGRWDSNKFNLDATHPFSILQAFSAALTTFDARTLESFKMTY